MRMVFTARDWVRRLTWFTLIIPPVVAVPELLQASWLWGTEVDILTQFLVTIALFVLAIIVTLWLLGRVLRDGRRRARAIMGDASRMPLARHLTPVTPAPSLAGAPLEALWLPRRSRVGSGFAAGLVTLTALGCLAFAGVLFAGPWLFPSPIGTPLVVFFGGGLFFAVVALILFAITRPVWREALAPTQRIGIVADAVGLHEHRLGRRERMVRWEDARLLEVANPQTANTGALTFTVFAPRGRVSWTTSPSGPGPEERSALQAAHSAVLALLNERAGLQPRTFEASLRRDRTVIQREGAATTPRRQSLLLRLGALVIFACLVALWLALMLTVIGALLAMAYACIAVPLTGVPALDGYAAGATLVPAATFVYMVARAISAHWHEVPLPSFAPVPSAPSYELRWRTPASRRILLGLVGVALLPAGALGVWGFVRWAGDVISHAPYTGLASVMPIASVGPIFASMLGIVLLFRGITGSPHMLRADARGLFVEGTPRHMPTTLLWEDVHTLTLQLATFHRGTFTVRGRELGQFITWPTNIPIVPAPPGADGTQPITPLELAALVAAHTDTATGSASNHTPA